MPPPEPSAVRGASNADLRPVAPAGDDAARSGANACIPYAAPEPAGPGNPTGAMPVGGGIGTTPAAAAAGPRRGGVEDAPGPGRLHH